MFISLAATRLVAFGRGSGSLQANANDAEEGVGRRFRAYVTGGQRRRTVKSLCPQRRKTWLQLCDPPGGIMKQCLASVLPILPLSTNS